MIASQRNQPRWPRQWAYGLCLCAVTTAAQPGPRVIDRAVASIQGKVVTASSLEFEARILLVNAGGVEAAFAPLDHEALAASLETVINQRLAVLEADKLEAYPLEPGELERAIAAFRGRFGDEGRFAAFLARHEATLDELGAVLRRSLRAERALEGKLRLRAQVTDREARAHLAAHPELAQAEVEAVRAMLVRQRFAELVRRELAEQRRQVDVRLLGPYAPRKESR